MRIQLAPIGLTALAALTACGGGGTTYTDAEGNEVEVSRDGDTEYTVRTEDGEATMRSGGGLVAELPMGLKPYPGAEIVTSSIGNSNGRSGGMVIMRTSDSQDQVIEFYRAKAKALGIEIQTEMKGQDSHLIGGAREDGAGINVMAAREDGGTTISLTFADADTAE